MTESQNPVALITGGTRGIGLGIARALAGEGWDLAVNGVRDQEDVQSPLAELREAGAHAVYCQADVGDDAMRRAMIDRVREQFGRLDLLVNNAGITSPGRLDILDATEEAYDRVMAVNLKGAFFLSQLAGRWMVEQRRADPQYRGVQVNISSVSGQFVSVNRGDYCISWAGMEMVTRLWAARLAEFGISVYEVRPGIIRTDMTAGVTEKYDRLLAEGLAVERRWGTPEDVGRAVAVLARGELTYATGNVLYVDGGMNIQRL